MPKRIDELVKTWVPGPSRGTTVFNTYGNMSVAYGRNRLFVSGSGGSGNCLVPGNIATYTGNSIASYNSGTAATYNQGSPASYTGNSANYNAGNPSGYTGNSAIPASSGNNANYNPCTLAYNTPTISGYNTGTAAPTYNPGNVSGYTPGNISGYNVGVATSYNAPTPGGYNVRNVSGYNSGTATYTAGNPASYVGGTNNVSGYNTGAASYNTGNPASYNPGDAAYNPPSSGVNWNAVVTVNGTVFGGGSPSSFSFTEYNSGFSPTCPSPTFAGPEGGTGEGDALFYTYTEYSCTPGGSSTQVYNPGNISTYNGPLVNWNASLIETLFDEGYFYYQQLVYPGSGSSVGCPAPGYNYSQVTGANFPNFPGFITGGGQVYYTYNIFYTCGPSSPGNAATYNPGSLVYTPGNPASYNPRNISGYVGNNISSYNTGTPSTYTGNIIGGYTGNNANYNSGNPSGYTAGNAITYGDNNANYNQASANYNAGGSSVSGYTGNNANYNAGNSFVDCSGATITGYNPPGSSNPIYSPGVCASYTGNNVATYNAGTPASYTGNNVSTYNAPGNAVYTPGNISGYIGNNTASYNAAGNQNYNPGSAQYNAGNPASYTGNNANYTPGNATSYNPGNPASYNPPDIVGYNPPSGGGGGGGCCFVGDTLVTMSDLSVKPIKNIQIGDEILSYNEETAQLETNEVAQVLTRVNRVMFEYTLQNGITIRASDDHPFFVLGKGYSSLNPELTTQAYRGLSSVAQVEVGDKFVDKDGNAIQINQIVPIEYPYIVYTIVNKNKSSPNFFANGVLTY